MHSQFTVINLLTAIKLLLEEDIKHFWFHALSLPPLLTKWVIHLDLNCGMCTYSLLNLSVVCRKNHACCASYIVLLIHSCIHSWSQFTIQSSMYLNPVPTCWTSCVRVHLNYPSSLKRSVVFYIQHCRLCRFMCVTIALLLAFTCI
jgi:hypothetical protein